MGEGGVDSGGTSGGGTSGGGTSGGGDAGHGNAAGEGASAGAGGETTGERIVFSVHADEGVRPISPLIYGANQPGLDCDDAKARFTFCRHRSNSWSTYNWETNASNAGKADCNENNDALSASSSPGAAIVERIDAAAAVHAGSVVTLPTLGYVAADKASGSAAPECSGDISASVDYLNTRVVKSRAHKGAALSLTPDTSDGWVNQDELVAFLKSVRGDANLLFSLDSQPELWHLDHDKLRSQPLGYAEHLALSESYAKAIKDNWAGAPVLGLVGYGFLAAYNLQESPDFATDGPFLPYFLQGMSERSQQAGVRLLDYVDLHWLSELYPDGARVIYDGATPAAVAARVQAPRSLWDPDFVEDSWIGSLVGGPIELLSWMQDAVDDNYPGTRVSLSEWAYGGTAHVSGAIAAADALGTFGQRGVGLAGALSFGTQSPYLIGAFQAYRNYDGQGSAFGDTSVSATSSDVSRAAIYASIDSADPSRLVLVAINRSAEAVASALTVEHDTSYASLKPYCITDGHAEPAAGSAIPTEGNNAFSLQLPAYSVCTLVATE